MWWLDRRQAARVASLPTCGAEKPTFASNPVLSPIETPLCAGPPASSKPEDHGLAHWRVMAAGANRVSTARSGATVAPSTRVGGVHHEPAGALGTAAWLARKSDSVSRATCQMLLCRAIARAAAEQGRALRTSVRPAVVASFQRPIL